MTNQELDEIIDMLKDESRSVGSSSFPCGSKVGWPDARAHMKALDELEKEFGRGMHILRLSFGELPTGLVHDGERLV